MDTSQFAGLTPVQFITMVGLCGPYLLALYHDHQIFTSWSANTASQPATTKLQRNVWIKNVDSSSILWTNFFSRGQKKANSQFFTRSFELNPHPIFLLLHSPLPCIDVHLCSFGVGGFNVKSNRESTCKSQENGRSFSAAEAYRASSWNISFHMNDGECPVKLLVPCVPSYCSCLFETTHNTPHRCIKSSFFSAWNCHSIAVWCQMCGLLNSSVTL